MTTTTADPLATLAANLETEIAGTKSELTRFPSGAAMLDVRRSDGHVFVLSFAPEHGYSVDEARADDGFVSDYRFTYSDLAPAARKLRELVAGQPPAQPLESPIALNLVVVQARDLEVAKQFYECLGIVFRLEQHGRGPQHYAAEIGSTVFEVYPCRAGSITAHARFGFAVRSLDVALSSLRGQSARILGEPSDSPWGRRAVVEDPDGNRVELLEQR